MKNFLSQSKTQDQNLNLVLNQDSVSHTFNQNEIMSKAKEADYILIMVGKEMKNYAGDENQM